MARGRPSGFWSTTKSCGQGLFEETPPKGFGVSSHGIPFVKTRSTKNAPEPPNFSHKHSHSSTQAGRASGSIRRTPPPIPPGARRARLGTLQARLGTEDGRIRLGTAQARLGTQNGRPRWGGGQGARAEAHSDQEGDSDRAYPGAGRSRDERCVLRTDTRNLKPDNRNPAPETREPTYPRPETRNSTPDTRHPRHETRNTRHEARNTKHQTRNPRSGTRNSQPRTRNSNPQTPIPNPKP